MAKQQQAQHQQKRQLIFRFDPRNDKQREAIDLWEHNDIMFLTGPAGTGKTQLAVYLAIQHLHQISERRRRNSISEKRHDTPMILVTRPAVMAGEDIGFLPGDMGEKFDPYLEPFRHSFRKIFFPDDSGVLPPIKPEDCLEAVPLGFMRGRTIEGPRYPVAILDEAQNCTFAQIVMFLTRLGDGGKLIVTGDPEQSDIGQWSGLVEACRRYRGIMGMKIVQFTEVDQCRHPLVTKIIRASQGYEPPVKRW